MPPPSEPPQLPPEAPAEAGPSLAYPAFRQLTFHAVLAGLCPLVPVPFLDDWLLARVRRILVADLGRSRDLDLAQEVRIALAGGSDGWRFTGCAAGCLWLLRKVVLKLLVKLSRKVFYFLAVGESLHAATQVFHEGYLLAYALDAEGPPRHPEAARRLRRDVLATVEAMDLTPVRDTLGRTFQGSRRQLRRAARVLARPFSSRRRRRRMEDEAAVRAAAEEVRAEEEALLGSLVDRLARTLWGNRQYLARLEARFEARRGESEEGP